MPISKTKRELLFYSLFEDTVDGIFLADADFKIYDTDGSFIKTLKYEISEEQKVGFQELLYNESDFEALQVLLRKKKRLQNFEVELKSRTGKRIYAELNILKNKDKELNEVFYQGFFFDVTKRKQAEKQLVQAEKGLAAGKLSRILAHEVRNPLTNVQLALEQLKDEFGDKTEDADLYFDVIKRNSERISNLISALLNSSKPRTAMLSNSDLNQTVVDAIDLVRDRLMLKHIKLNLILKENLPGIKLDKEQMKIALINIMVNAIEAIENDNGNLTVQTKSNKHSIQISIKDNGPGMTPDEAEQLFEPFYTKKRKGTGLGLTAVQNIIHAHNGSITVKSRPNKGAIFIISLPR